MTDDNITFLMQVKGVTAGVTVFVAFLTIFGVVKTFPYLVEYIGTVGLDAFTYLVEYTV